jgi:hypothetical protein
LRVLPAVVRTGELVRKLWSPHQFRPHISPHELLQAIVDTSDKRFQITQQSFVIDLLTWYLNTLHARLAGPPTKKNRNPQSIVTECFQVRFVSSVVLCCVVLCCVVLCCVVLCCVVLCCVVLCCVVLCCVVLHCVVAWRGAARRGVPCCMLRGARADG